MKYYDENRNGYYNPDDGQDSRLPGENANWRAIQAGFAASAAKDSQQDTDVASAVNVAEAARRTADQALEAAQAAGGDITDLEAAVRTAQQTADSAGTAASSAMTAAQAAQSAADGAAAAAQSAGSAASAAQTTADGAASDAASARNMASDAFQTATQANQTAGNAADGVSALLPRVAALESGVSDLETPYDVLDVKLSINATYELTVPANGFAVWTLVSSGGFRYPSTGPDSGGGPLSDVGRYAVWKGNKQFTFTSGGSANLIPVFVRGFQTDGGDQTSLTVSVDEDGRIINGRIEVGIFNNDSANVVLPANSGIVADVLVRRAGEVWT